MLWKEEVLVLVSGYMEVEDLLFILIVLGAFYWTTIYPPKWLLIR